MPRLPPAKLMANLVGVTSDFIESRRAWLVRWLTIVTSHPVTREDGMVRCRQLSDRSREVAFLRWSCHCYHWQSVPDGRAQRARQLAAGPVPPLPGRVRPLQQRPPGAGPRQPRPPLRGGRHAGPGVELQTKLREYFAITEEAVPTSIFTFNV